MVSIRDLAADGLLGSFDNVMAGLTADEIAAVVEPVGSDPPPDVVPPTAIDQYTDPHFVATHRVVDAHAREAADRLLRRAHPFWRSRAVS